MNIGRAFARFSLAAGLACPFFTAAQLAITVSPPKITISDPGRASQFVGSATFAFETAIVGNAAFQAANQYLTFERVGQWAGNATRAAGEWEPIGFARPGARVYQCLPAGTLVLMADGTTKAIEAIKAGDLVLADDPEGSAQAEARPVTQTHRNWTKRLIHVAVDKNGDGVGDGELQATGEHPIWTQNRGWISAVDLLAGDRLLDARQGEPTVLSAVSVPTTCTTYNLSVEGSHTFFVLAGQTPVLVHNVDPVPTTRISVIYTAPDPNGGIYVGRASRLAATLDQFTERQVLEYRFGTGHHRGIDINQTTVQETIFGGGKGSGAYDAIRGAEHLYWEKLQNLGLGAQQNSPIDANNPRMGRYIEAAKEMGMGPCP